MKTNLLKSIFISLILLVGTTNAWGYTISDAKVYYDDSNSQWSSNVVIAFDKNDGGAVFSMGKISNTNLHYWEGTWGESGVSYMRFGKTTKTYNWYGWWESVGSTWDLSTNDNWDGVSNGWGTDISSVYKMFGAESSTKGANLTKTDLTDYTSLNYTQKVQQHLSTDNGSSYSASTTALATVKVSSYKLSSKNATASNSGTIASGSSSATCSAARTATVTYTVSAVKTGYTFVGWYDGTTLQSTNTTYKYNATGAKTITARFIPHTVNDYRLVYIESEVLGETPYTKFHPAHAITKQTTGTTLDTVSFYINKTDGQNPAILLQQCTEINGTSITWQDIAIQYINGNSGADPGGAMAPARKSVDLYIGNGCPAVTENAVYNFILQQDNGTATILGENTHPYVGNYYIRTNCANGGWNNYTTDPDNLMTHSETALKHGEYDYYFCKWVANANYNVKYTVANDYSHCVSDTLTGDDIVGSNGNLPAKANVRFTWNSSTNHLERAYISGSSTVSDRFLVLEGDANLKDANGNSLNVSGLNANEAIFNDMNDWRYQVDVKVDDNTKIKLTAKYNNQVQYFKGSETETEGLITGAQNRSYKIRLIYDFKTNYLLSALIDSDPIEEDISVDEVMIIREHQELAQSLNVTTGSISNIQNIYGVMTFHQTTLNNTETPMMERALYWVSFPFDVNLEDAFGFGNYGEHWIMEYYDGAERAEKGGWIDATYWKYITNPSGVELKKGVGYVLCLDLDKLSSVWGNATEISLYFPSLADNSTISKEEIEDVVVLAHECTINRPTPDGDRRIKDSNWNIIGVPSFTNATTFDSKDVKFYYHWYAETDTYTAQVATEFNTMHAYMTQFAGTIKWTEQTIEPAAIAARKASSAKDQYTLRLALQQEDAQCDHTFIRLQEDNATAEFDMNYDLCKIINSGANIYSMIGNVEVAANVLPIEECVIPLGLDIHATGNYTFSMPDGTDGITAILIDYETGKETNLLLADYTTELREGTNNERFALRVRPNHVATEVETIINGANGQLQKYIINGALYILNNGQLYDAQGRMVQQ